MTAPDERLESQMEEILEAYDNKIVGMEAFMNSVMTIISRAPVLSSDGISVVHSCKCRLKDREHLRNKIQRKMEEGREINAENLFDQVTDLAGVRILHLFQEDFRQIDEVIRTQVAEGEWILVETPKAYTWDPETEKFFDGFDELDVHKKDSSYTSVHYLVRSRIDSPYCCEIQVRTLFEEIWGEVDHQINYPVATSDVACKEQIMVLSKIVGAGSRLLDSLRRVTKIDEW